MIEDRRRNSGQRVSGSGIETETSWIWTRYPRSVELIVCVCVCALFLRSLKNTWGHKRNNEATQLNKFMQLVQVDQAPRR